MKKKIKHKKPKDVVRCARFSFPQDKAIAEHIKNANDLSLAMSPFKAYRSKAELIRNAVLQYIKWGGQ